MKLPPATRVHHSFGLIGSSIYLPPIEDECMSWLFGRVLQNYLFTSRPKGGVENKPTNALSWLELILSRTTIMVSGFNELCPDLAMYVSDVFRPVLWSRRLYLTRWLFVFRPNIVHSQNLSENFFWGELHVGGLDGHFRKKKTTKAVMHQFFWPSLKQDVAKVVKRCDTCQLAKQWKQTKDLYMPLSIPSCPWQDVGIDFVLGLLKTHRQYDSFVVVVDYFLKIAHFYCSPIPLMPSELQRHFLKAFSNCIACLKILSFRDVKFTWYFYKLSGII